MNPPKQPNIFNTDIKRRNWTQLYTLPKGVLKESYKVWYLWAYRTVRSTEVSVFLEVYVIIVEVQNAWSFGILESIVRKTVRCPIYKDYSRDKEVLYPWAFTEVRITEVSLRIMDVLSFASD